IIVAYESARRRAAVTIDPRPPASPATLPEHSAVRSSRPLDLTGTRDRYLPPDLLLTVVRLQFAQIGKQPLQRHHEHPVRLDTVVDESQSRPEMSCPTSDDHPRIHRCPALTRPPSIVARKVVTAPVPTEAGGRCAAVPARTARSTTGPHRQRPWNHAAPHGRGGVRPPRSRYHPRCSCSCTTGCAVVHRCATRVLPPLLVLPCYAALQPSRNRLSAAAIRSTESDRKSV